MSPLSLPSDAFRLGGLIAVPSLNRLVREGRTDDVEPRVMRVLAALAETPGEVVTRADLFDAVWSDTVVNDEALTRAVSELRKALAPEASGAIETIRGTGYRLALPIAPLAPEAHESSGADSADRAPEAPPRSASSGVLVRLALGVAVVALAVAVWAAWPRTAPEASGEIAAPEATEGPRLQFPQTAEDRPEPMRLDSTSPYYQPGLSELGVYYDSTADAYFKFTEEDD
ncbi:MAG: winged helix-turn-helix domain-containing protein [Bacteroidota bacterium]